MGTVASQITSLTIVYSIVYSDADQRKHQSSGEFPAQMTSYAENVSIWWRHHEYITVKRDELHGILNQRNLNCLLDNLFKLTKN